MQADDLKAIDAYIMGTKPTTPTQQALQADWRRWYSGLNIIQKNTMSSTLEEARQRRDAYNAARAAGSPVMVTSGPAAPRLPPKVSAGTKPTIKEGSHKTNPSLMPFIEEWQRVIHATPVDGKFGPGTKSLTVAWQKARGLTADGIVGPMTWSRAQQEGSQLMTAAAQAADIVSASTKPVSASTKPTLKVGIHKTNPSTVPYVREWQQIVGVKVDGQFGSGTQSATKTWQKARGLTADGIVGPKTWAAVGTPAKTVSASTKPVSASTKPIVVKHTDKNKPTLKKGSNLNPTYVAYVKLWQKNVGVKEDGIFGAGTETATKNWQWTHGLKADGIVGPATWASYGQPKSVTATTTPSAQPASKSVSASTKPVQAAATKVKEKATEAVTAAATTAKETAATAIEKAGEVSARIPLWAKVTGGVAVAWGAVLGYRSIKKAS